jgi:HEAT repeat protein
MAAVVALGRLRDRRAVTPLAQIAGDPLLAEATAVALGEIADPAGLEPLRALLVNATPSLQKVVHRAAASVLAAHPDTPVPDWLRASLRGHEEELGVALRRERDDCAARLLGAAGTPEAARQLGDCLGDPELQPAAAAGLALLPRAVATASLLRRLPHTEGEGRAALLRSLPPLADAEEVRQVLPCLADAHAGARAAAAEALGHAPEALALPALLEALGDPALREGAAQALGRVGPVRCDPLLDLLDDADARVRAAAAEALAGCGAKPGERLREALRRETDSAARRAMIHALGAGGGGSEAIGDLVALLESDDVGVRFAAASALGETRDPDALAPLLGALGDPAREVQAAALRALGRLGDPRAGEPLVRRLDAGGRDLRRTAAAALREIAPAAARDRLLRALDDRDWEIRLAAVRTLERLGDGELEAPLRQVAETDPDALVREAAEAALAAHAGRPASGEGGAG